MSTKTEEKIDLKINYLTEEQYQDALAKGEISDNEIYMTPSVEEDESNIGSLTDLGVTATAAELNHMSGVSENVQVQLDNKVPITRTVNKKVLSSDITLSASDVNADPAGTASSAVSTHNASTNCHSDIRNSISSLQSSLSGKADTSHSHAISDVTNLQTELNNKLNTSEAFNIDNSAKVLKEECLPSSVATITYVDEAIANALAGVTAIELPDTRGVKF